MQRPIPVIVLAVLLVSAGSAHAQTTQDSEAPSETMGRWVGGTNQAVQDFGNAGDALANVTAGSFVGAGTGTTKRSLARGWNTTFAEWRALSKATKDSLPYKVAPALFAASDVSTIVGSAIEGDGKGAASGAVNMAVSSLTTTGGAAAGASLFSAIGGTVGTFVFPVAGTAAGTMVGGAIGTVTGGFVASIAYDRYGKSIVGNIVEGGLSVLFDPDPLQDAIRAREDFLRKQAAPELQANWDYNTSVGASYGQEEEQLFKPLRGVYELKAPPAAAPFAALQSVRRIQISTWGKDTPQYKVPLTCDFTGNAVRCTGTFRIDTPGARSWSTYVLQGTLSENVISGNTNLLVSAEISNGSPCKSFTYEYSHHETITLAEDGSVASQVSPSTGRLTKNNCSPMLKATMDSPGATSIGTWRVIN